jgi:class 3 adenylate cyclase
MSENPDTKHESSVESTNSENPSPEIHKQELSESSKPYIDMLLGRKGPKVVDTETLISETQKRVWNSLTKGYEYPPIVDDSDKFLRKHVFSRINMIVLYVDLVGSTDITLSLPEDKVAIIISSFAQEMASTIMQHDGYVLKFVGDAVIGYFIAEGNIDTADNAVNCAKSMLMVIEKGINPILNQYDYPELMVKIGLDFGQNIVMRYGGDAEKSHVDILGPAMNIASKIQSMAKPNQILIGEDVYTRLHPTIQKSFEKVVWSKHKWKYQDRETGQLYPVFAYVG